MVALLSHEERVAFKRCRRAWDYGARGRRNLEAIATVELPDPDRVLRDALAVYYFPGMWDWSRAVVLPLVGQALDKSLAKQTARLGPDVPPGVDALTATTRQLLGAYMDWAPEVDRFSPVLVEVDYQADISDPDEPEEGLFTPAGEHLRYQGRVDLLAVDEHDAYWIVRHHVVKEWTPLDALLRDEETVTACWAWERFYIGMEIAGTVHNEMRLPARPLSGDKERPAAEPGGRRGGIAQHEGSGGGRSIPQHRRLYARAAEPIEPEQVVHETGPYFRRTWIRRSRHEVAHAGRQVAREAGEIFAPEVAVYPSPSEAACGRCPFSAPCLALYEGRIPQASAILASSYRARSQDQLEEGRLGGVTWSVGRGAAPQRFSGRDA
jgi:hypothetical protein